MLDAGGDRRRGSEWSDRSQSAPGGWDHADRLRSHGKAGRSVGISRRRYHSRARLSIAAHQYLEADHGLLRCALLGLVAGLSRPRSSRYVSRCLRRLVRATSAHSFRLLGRGGPSRRRSNNGGWSFQTEVGGPKRVFMPSSSAPAYFGSQGFRQFQVWPASAAR